MAEAAAPTDVAAATAEQASAPGVTNQAPEPEVTPIIPPEIKAIRTPAADAMEVTTLLTESEALVGAFQELSTSLEGQDGDQMTCNSGKDDLWQINGIFPSARIS